MSKDMETRVRSMFKEFLMVLGGWKREGKWKDVESLTMNVEKNISGTHNCEYVVVSQ